MTNQLPPRERGLKPTHFIDVWKGVITGKLFYGIDKHGLVGTPNNPVIEPNVYNPDYSTIAIFKIYPKNIS